MSAAFVQSRSVNNTASLAFNSDNTGGNAIIVVVSDSGSTVSTFTCTDSNGRTYLTLGQVNNGGGGGQAASAQLFYIFGIAAGPNTITVTSSGSVNKLAIHEFSGINTLDVSNSATGTGNSQNSGSVTTNFAVELLFGFEFANVSQNSTTHGASYTQAENLTNFITQYQIVSSTGTFSSDTTGTTTKGGATNWAAEIATFYLSAADPYAPARMFAMF